MSEPVTPQCWEEMWQAHQVLRFHKRILEIGAICVCIALTISLAGNIYLYARVHALQDSLDKIVAQLTPKKK